MANQSYSLLKKLFITIFAYSFVLSSCSSSKRCNFDELYKKGNQTFDDIESCNVGLLRTCTIENIYQLGDSISDAGNSILEGPAGASSPFRSTSLRYQLPDGPHRPRLQRIPNHRLLRLGAYEYIVIFVFNKIYFC